MTKKFAIAVLTFMVAAVTSLLLLRERDLLLVEDPGFMIPEHRRGEDGKVALHKRYFVLNQRSHPDDFIQQSNALLCDLLSDSIVVNSCFISLVPMPWLTFKYRPGDRLGGGMHSKTIFYSWNDEEPHEIQTSWGEIEAQRATISFECKE